MWTNRTLVEFKSLLVIGCLLALTGCTNRYNRNQELIPASEVLNASCCKPDTETQINFLALRRQPPKQYILDSGDTLGIYIQGITGDKDVPPPVHFPEDPNIQPALGYPVPIRDDGFISLPLVAPINVQGMTLAQAEERIRKSYTEDKKILLEGNEKIIVTLMQRRTYNVLVVREDIVEGGSRGTSLNRNEIFVDEGKQTQSFSIELPAYENDVLHALSETGGMPGERALNEIFVFRGGMQNLSQPGGVVQLVDNGQQPTTIDSANVISIPIKGEPGEFPQLAESDITLGDGDVIFIKAREREVFYTGGLLDGGRYPLPRDYDIDVLEAMSMAGGSVSAAAGSGTGSMFRGIGSIKPATQVTIMRKCGCEQIAIDVDLRYAMSDTRERVIVQPGDLIILEYRKPELWTNAIFSIFQSGGVWTLFR